MRCLVSQTLQFRRLSNKQQKLLRVSANGAIIAELVHVLRRCYSIPFLEERPKSGDFLQIEGDIFTSIHPHPLTNAQAHCKDSSRHFPIGARRFAQAPQPRPPHPGKMFTRVYHIVVYRQIYQYYLLEEQLYGQMYRQAKSWTDRRRKDKNTEIQRNKYPLHS